MDLVRACSFAAAVTVGTLLLALAGCPTKSSPSAMGEECFSAGDCQPGLICVTQKSGARVCTDDLSQVTGRPPTRADAGDAATDGSTDGEVPATRDAASDDDAAPSDSGADTGAPPRDAGATDAGDAGDAG